MDPTTSTMGILVWRKVSGRLVLFIIASGLLSSVGARASLYLDVTDSTLFPLVQAVLCGVMIGELLAVSAWLSWSCGQITNRLIISVLVIEFWAFCWSAGAGLLKVGQLRETSLASLRYLAASVLVLYFVLAGQWRLSFSPSTLGSVRLSLRQLFVAVAAAGLVIVLYTNRPTNEPFPLEFIISRPEYTIMSRVVVTGMISCPAVAFAILREKIRFDLLVVSVLWTLVVMWWPPDVCDVIFLESEAFLVALAISLNGFLAVAALTYRSEGYRIVERASNNIGTSRKMD